MPREASKTKLVGVIAAAAIDQRGSPPESGVRVKSKLAHSAGKTSGIKVVFSYSHRDQRLRDEIEKHLAALKRSNLVHTWHDRRISPGKDLSGEIASRLDTADLLLLLVSADFLNSDYCYQIEMRRALERHDRGEARVIPIILRAAEWLYTPIGRLLALPTDGKPVTEWSNRDRALLDIAKGIRKAVEELCAAKRARSNHPMHS